MRKKIFLIISFLIVVSIITSCTLTKNSSKIVNTDSTISSDKQKSISDYVTMTYSEYANNENNGNIKTKILSYDTDTKKVKKVFQFDYTAQYPLGFYDKINQLVYYTQRVGDDKNYGDQIFVRDLSTNKSTQLTDDLFAVNYIVPVENKLFFVANIKGEEAIRLGSIDLKTKKRALWGNSDMLVEAITVDRDQKKIYASAYSLKERNNSLKNQEGPVGQNNFKMPMYTVYETNYFLDEKTKLFSKNYWIRMLMNKEGHVIAFADKEYNKGQVPSTVIDYDTVKRSFSESKWGETRLQRGEANYSSDGSKIYSIAIVKNQRGFFEYNIEEDKFSPIFTPTEGFINNIQIIKGNNN